MRKTREGTSGRQKFYLDMSIQVEAAIKLFYIMTLTFSLHHDTQGAGQEGGIRLRESSNLGYYMRYFKPWKMAEVTQKESVEMRRGARTKYQALHPLEVW